MGIVLALSAIFAVVISSITLQKDNADAQLIDPDAEAIEARAKAWFNSLTLDEAINALLGTGADAGSAEGRQYFDGEDPQILNQSIEFIKDAYDTAMDSDQTFYDALPAVGGSLDDDQTTTDRVESNIGEANKERVKIYVDGLASPSDDDIYAVGRHLENELNGAPGMTAIRGFQSVELWWNFADCRQKVIAVGVSNMEDTSSAYCNAASYAGLPEEQRARAKMAGMAILGEGTVELNSELPPDNTAAAKRWWNALNGPQMVAALWGNDVTIEGDAQLGGAAAVADYIYLTRRMYDDIGEPIQKLALDAASMARATRIKNLINDRFALISGGSYDSAEEWWGSIGCLEMNIAVGADNEPRTDSGFCVGFDELSKMQNRAEAIVSPKERVLKVGNAILGLPGLPRVAAWWDTLDEHQMVNVVYGKYDGDGERVYTAEQRKLFQSMYDGLRSAVYMVDLPGPTRDLLRRHGISDAPGFDVTGDGDTNDSVDHDGQSGTNQVEERNFIALKLVVDTIAAEIFDPPTAYMAWVRGTALFDSPEANVGNPVGELLNDKEYDPPHQSVADWWETLDCRTMRIAVGEDNNYLNEAQDPDGTSDSGDEVPVETSVYCKHIPGHDDNPANDLTPEAQARVFEVGAALLGLSVEEATTTRPSFNDPPPASASVVITGVPQVGADLVATIGSFMDDGVQITDADVTFTWYADGVEIGTGKVYTLKSSDTGKNITVRATYNDGQSFPESIQGSLPSDVEIVGSAGEISKIEPAISGLTVSPGDEVKLSVLVYGLQGIQDNSLVGSSSVITWSVGGASLDETGVEIMYTAPSAPGTYMVTASLDQAECLPDNEDEKDAACSAEFKVTVQRTSVAPPPPEAPKNPPGEIPAILTDSDGNQYEVFTPEGGGSFTGEGFNVTAEPGVIPNGEFIGIRISEDGPASNMGMTQHRYTLGGNMYTVSAVDATGAAISSYALRAPATVCLPLPDELRHNISNLALVTINADGTQTVLSASVRLGSAGTHVCGNLSSLPASVAVASAGSPAPLPTPVPPTATPVPPDTGGLAPASSAGMALWALLFGIGVVTVGTFLLLGTARARNRSRKTQS